MFAANARGPKCHGFRCRRFIPGLKFLREIHRLWSHPAGGRLNDKGHHGPTPVGGSTLLPGSSIFITGAAATTNRGRLGPWGL